MAATLLILNLFYLLSILISSGAHGVHIRVYRYLNFTGLDWEIKSSGSCSNIPKDKHDYFKSINTDTCFIAYYHPNCKSWRSQKYMPGYNVLVWMDLTWFQSIQVCNEEEGGSQLNLDITKYHGNHAVVPDVLESYRNVCSCVNVPQHVQRINYWSINNHHNALLAYYEPDCSENKWDSNFIPAGHIHFYTNAHENKITDSVTNTTYKFQSFGPDSNSKYFQSCLFAAVTNKLTELQGQVDQSKRTQYNFQRTIHEQEEDIDKLTDDIKQLKQICQNFTQKIKSDLNKIFA